MHRAGSDELHLFTRKVLIVAVIAIALALLWRVRNIAFLVFIAGVLATAIAPAVRRVQILGRHYTRHKLRRGTAVLIVYLPVLLLVLVIAFFALPQLSAETRQLTTVLPQVLESKILQPLEKHVPVGELRRMLAEKPKHIEVLPYLRSVATVISSLVAIAVMIMYMLLDAERLKNLFLIFYPAEDRARKQRMIRRASRRMSAWLAGQLLLAGIVGGATLIGLLLLRVPYALPLALLAGVGELVPVIGPIVGALPALVIALMHSTWQFWSVLAMAVLIQQVENHILVPRLMGSIVSISPLSVIIAFMVGATLFGIPGAMMAVPLAAIAQVVFEESFVSRRERRQDGGRPGTLIKGSW
jgi:predicted PurR-regulated permease PerM